MICKPIVMSAAGNSDPVYPSKRMEASIRLSLHLVIEGTVDATVQYCIAPVSANEWINHSDLTAETGDAVGTVISTITAYRLVYNSGTGTATLYGAE